MKLEKLEVRQFSGQRREYTAWKHDFCDVGIVPGRPAAEIGLTLKSCVPEKFLYLFDNLSLSEHAEMMKILDEKFGKARLVIDDTVNELEKMRPVTTDKDFIVFVDKLEKIQRDLSELKMESEIQNSTVLSKLEQKLPYLVRRDWIIKVSDKEYDSKSPKEIFTDFMEFLRKTKKQVEYDNSESRVAGSLSKTKTCKSFTMGEVETKASSGVSSTTREPSRNLTLFLVLVAMMAKLILSAPFIRCQTV